MFGQREALPRLQGRAVGLATARHRIVAQRIQAVLGKGLAAAILLVATRVVEVLIGIALVSQLSPHFLVGEAISRGLEAVIFELHIRGAYRLPVVELPHIGALLEGTVAEVEEELGTSGQGDCVIGKHDAVFARFKLVEVEHPLFSGEAVHEIEVALPVLDTVFPLGVLVLERKGVIGDAVFLQEDTENFIGFLCLKDAGVLAKRQTPQGRLYQQLIAGAAKAAVTLREVTDHPTHPALQRTVVPHQQLARLVQHGTKVDVGLGACQLQAQVERPVERFIQRKLGHHEGALWQGPHLDGKL